MEQGESDKGNTPVSSEEKTSPSDEKNTNVSSPSEVVNESDDSASKDHEATTTSTVSAAPRAPSREEKEKDLLLGTDTDLAVILQTPIPLTT